jgi:hypothetical protein
MSIRDEAIEEIRRAPEEIVAEALDFLRFLTARTREDQLSTAIASESVLRGDWDTPDEDEAWKDL